MTAAARVNGEQDEALAPAFQAAQAICRRHAGSDYFAANFLPKPKRLAAYSVYAFCRLMGDAIAVDDHAIEGASGLRHYPMVASHGTSGCCGGGLENRLDLFRERLEEIYADRLEMPGVHTRSEEQHALHAFISTVLRYEIPKQYFFDFAEGLRMDAKIARYATWTSTEKYCYHTGGVIGLILGSVLGLRHSASGVQAVALGNAFRLTGILRDLKDDAARGRIYLPLEDLARFRYSESDLKRGIVNDNFRQLMRFEIDRARSLYEQGLAGLCWLADDGSRLMGAIVASLHGGILQMIERQKYDVFSSRAALSTAQKFRRLPVAWRLARRNADQSTPRV